MFKKGFSKDNNMGGKRKTTSKFVKMEAAKDFYGTRRYMKAIEAYKV
jgi:hypothetical protein